ncbi:coiled-coil domain-containing protein [Fusobacterium polymorphum]|uniref:hypothetical protein n=1 Tax=Fusobacterium nucleatum subsp. polymorphum TaxID=76857 RepID=UPI002B4BE785|nr:hypothetical protein [Fusobacterium polymorphum]WRL74748.1 hypothetical protein VKN80_09080 [Fusobacterium polymorphum]
MIEKIKSIEELGNLNDFKEIINILIEKTNELETELKDLNTNFDSRVREIVEKYLVEINNKNEVLETQTEKININKFIETFPKDIKVENFSEEMENEAIVNKLIEIFKNIFGRKDEKLKKASDDIESKTLEINKLKEIEKKLDKEIEAKEKQIETLNTKYKEEKEKFENDIKELDEKIRNKEINIKNLETQIETLNIEYKEEKIKFEKNIEELNKEKTKLNEDINTLSEKYKELEKSNNELIKDKNEKEIKAEKLMKKYEKVKQERDSMGDLLVARRLYNEYLEMNTEVKSKFKNILLQKDFESFLSSGYSTSTMDNIWDIVKVEYKNIPSENLEKLREIFKFFIMQMNKKFKDPNFALIEATLEEEFDPVTQFDLSQNSRGKIAEFIFYGYGTLEDKTNSKDEDIIEKIKKRPLVLTK